MDALYDDTVGITMPPAPMSVDMEDALAETDSMIGLVDMPTDEPGHIVLDVVQRTQGEIDLGDELQGVFFEFTEDDLEAEAPTQAIAPASEVPGAGRPMLTGLTPEDRDEVEQIVANALSQYQDQITLDQVVAMGGVMTDLVTRQGVLEERLESISAQMLILVEDLENLIGRIDEIKADILEDADVIEMVTRYSDGQAFLKADAIEGIPQETAQIIINRLLELFEEAQLLDPARNHLKFENEAKVSRDVNPISPEQFAELISRVIPRMQEMDRLTAAMKKTQTDLEGYSEALARRNVFMGRNEDRIAANVEDSIRKKVLSVHRAFLETADEIAVFRKQMPWMMTAAASLGLVGFMSFAASIVQMRSNQADKAALEARLGELEAKLASKPSKPVWSVSTHNMEDTMETIGTDGDALVVNCGKWDTEAQNFGDHIRRSNEQRPWMTTANAKLACDKLNAEAVIFALED